MRAFDPGRLSGHPGINWDRSQLLKLPLAMVSNSSFLVLFSSSVLPILAASNLCLDSCGLLMYYGVYYGKNYGLNLPISMPWDLI